MLCFEVTMMIAKTKKEILRQTTEVDYLEIALDSIKRARKLFACWSPAWGISLRNSEDSDEPFLHLLKMNEKEHNM